MSNDITPLRPPNPFETYGEAAARSNGRFLKFSKGDFLGGADSEVVQIGTVMIAYMPGLTAGYVRWENGARTDRVMGTIVGGFRPPRRPDLGDTDRTRWETDDRGDPKDPWQFGNELPMIRRETPGEAYTFVTGSKGGIGAIGALCKEYGKHIKTKPNEIPIIRLDVKSYQHSNRSYGRIKVPYLEVIGWVDKGEYDRSGADPSVPRADDPETASAIEDQHAELATKAVYHAPPSTLAEHDDDMPPF
jgi:hypothetical protein